MARTTMVADREATLFASMVRALIAVALAIVGAIMAASALGWLGAVNVCGADRAPGCVSWPAPVSGLVWLAFVLGVAALLVWQVRYLDR